MNDFLASLKFEINNSLGLGPKIFVEMTISLIEHNVPTVTNKVVLPHTIY